MVQKEKHVHKLKRLKYKTGSSIFFCALPDCSFKTNTQLALGKRSICWRCGESFIMSDYSIRLAKPHCPNCHKSKEIKNEHNYIDENTPKLEELPLTLTLAERLKRSLEVHHKTSEAEVDEDI